MAFDRSFEALTGKSPFPWQEALFEHLAADPTTIRRCSIPTGLGKTSIIPIWLIALAANPAVVPRRLVYVVNRRTVVDQATDEAVKLRNALAGDQPNGVAELRSAIRNLCTQQDEIPLAISTLRGQFADNREWSADPSRPAIILGTVDMIGSRLLFDGYGIGFRLKPLHAGFLGQDVLLVHDEAHLEPAFQCLLNGIVAEQKRCGEFRPFHVIELSATVRNRQDCAGQGACEDGQSFGLTDKDRAVPEIKRRIEAPKAIHLHENDDKKLPDCLAELALKHEGANRTVLIFARTVDAVDKIAAALRKTSPLVETLTGTLRGKERDALVESEVFCRFLPVPHSGDRTAYLICTSAGEVGINISASDLICDLSTFESMAQRFGRVNRFGNVQDTRIDIVHPKEFDDKDKLQPRLKMTLELLRSLNGGGSPAALERLAESDRLAAFSPDPKILPASDILFDAWALTTVKDALPGRPPVEPYLHGIAEAELPETLVAWREEVGLITETLRQWYDPRDLLADYPLKPHELLRDRSNRIFDRLLSLAKAHPGAPAWLLAKEGEVTPITLGELADKNQKDRINFATILLPPSVGGLKNGSFTGKPDDPADDVADDWFDEAKQQRRCRTWDGDDVPDGMRLVLTLDLHPDGDAEEDEQDEQQAAPRRFWNWYARPRSADDDGSKTSEGAVAWDVHTDDVVGRAERIVAVLPLPDRVKQAIIIAAKHHDRGKKRIVWQRSIGNPTPTSWLAKSGKHFLFGRMKPMSLTEYRHEFGSLADVLDETEFQALDEDQRDLVLHLIAAHHGFARPHFFAEAVVDPGARTDPAQLAAEVPGRFARLQRKYGRWGLAYLESLLRAADYAASAAPSRTLEKQP